MELDTADRWTFLPKLYSEMQKLQVLQSHFNELYRHAISAMQTATVVTAVVSVYGAVRMTGLQSIHVFIVASLTLIMFNYIWSRFGDVYELSLNNILQEVNHIGQSGSAMKPFQRAMRPLKVKVGNFFFVDSMMMLTVLGIILENTASLLLAA